MPTEFNFFLKTLQSLQEVSHTDELCDSEEYKKSWFRAQLSMLAFYRQSLLDQALYEFGITRQEAHHEMAHFSYFTAVDLDQLIETIKTLKECRQKLINARIEYYKLLLNRQVLINDINAQCAISVDLKVIDYATNLLDSLNSKLHTLRMVGKETFGIKCDDLNACKMRLVEQIQAKKEHLSKLNAKKDVFERLAREYSQLTRQIQQKKIDLNRFKR